MLVKYECGCVGLPPNENKQALIFRWCDSDSEEPFSLSYTKNRVDTFEPLSADAEHHALSAINRLIAQGYTLRAVRAMLVPTDDLT